MIEYFEVRRKSDREIIGIIDGAKSVVWHSVYYGVGDFEVYAIASEKHIELLVEGNYITRPNDDEIGVIESVSSETTITDGTMLIASGRFAKSILDRRHIYKLSGTTNKVTRLSGNVETAIRTVITNNAISCSFDSSRNISFLELGASAGTTQTIVDEDGNAAEKQVSYENLLEYTDEVLQEYKLGSIVKIDDSTNKLQYSVYEGTDRSIDNTDSNEPIIFSQEYDNLTESTYKADTTLKKTSALIGGEGEGTERFYTLIAGTETGIDRREMWVDAASISKTYEDDSGTEHTYTDAEYTKVLKAQGKQELASNVVEESYEGSINVDGAWKIKEDYFVGDIVTFQDNTLGKYANVRITEITEVQDENGYEITPVFDFESGDEEVAVAVLTTESGTTITTETGVALQPETVSLTSASASATTTGVKISELTATTDATDTDVFPVVTSGETKKIAYVTIKTAIANDLDIEAISQSFIDNL